MTEWKTVQGSQETQPAEFDTTSSPTTVYQRRNVQRVTVNNADGTKAELWEYEERTMSREEYAVMAEVAKTQKDIAAIEDVLCSIDAVNEEA